jgi:thiol-disulfide isomerase/thioredoxin
MTEKNMKILKFGAIWCTGCIIMKPIWEEIEREMPELKTEYFDYDENPEIIKQWNLGDEIPVFIFLDDAGKEFARKKGQISKQELIEFIKENLEK